MKVAFDITPLRSGHKIRGIGLYTKELLDHFRLLKDVEIQEFLNISEVQGTDIVHFPYFDLFKRSLKISGVFPTVVTVHDVTPLLFPDHYPSGLRGKINFFFQKTALQKVAAIITDSQCSKEDINKTLGVDKDKIHSIYLAPSEKYQVIKDKTRLTDIGRRYSLPDKFALFVGNVNWNKNIINLTEACCKAGVDLVLVGGSFATKGNLDHPELASFKEFLQKFQDQRSVHILGFVPIEDLVAIMNLAKVLLLPSYYEGFGLTILEAQACGTPVITSNVSSLPEVVGDSALLVSPDDKENLASQIKTIFVNNNIRQKLIDKGFDNIKRFSWNKTARETLNVYKTICDK